MTSLDLKSYTKVINKETRRANKSVFQSIILKDATRFLMREIYLNDKTTEKRERVLRDAKPYTVIHKVARRLAAQEA